MEDRAEFGARQAEMTARWFENVKRTHGDVDAYIATRQAAYLDRWKEAGRFIEDGSTVLDVGGGNIYEQLVKYLKDRNFVYNYRDVDEGAVYCARDMTARFGLNVGSIERGFNDSLDFPDEHFDAVFSSHCVEHSIDLLKTFNELNRVLKVGGNLLIAVPFGWEENPEHPYFLGPSEWISLVEDAGFSVRVAQIGSEYPEFGEDYFIAARKIGSVKTFRLNPVDYKKNSYTYVKVDDEGTIYSGQFTQKNEMLVSDGNNCSIVIPIPDGASEVLPIFHRHSWSGIVSAKTGPSAVFADLYSWFTYDMPIFVKVDCSQKKAGGRPFPFSLLSDCSRSPTIKLELAGRNPASNWTEIGFRGYMYR